MSEEFVFWGPGGVPLLLMVGHRHTREQMRDVYNGKGFSEVATISVVGADLQETRRFYGQVLGMESLQDEATKPEFLDLANDLTGTPRGTPIHWLLYGGAGESSGKILVVHFLGREGKRLAGRMRPGRLGFSLMSHETRAFEETARRLAEARAIMRGPATVDGRRAILATGPNEELFEVIEASP
jgi:catechol 2,3-dioxygenase-like lactoylglutathione lyase family enzyme